MNKVYLLIGGNLEDRFGLLETAKRLIAEKMGLIIRVSSVYETAAWGFESEQDFLNQVVWVSTDLSSKELLIQCFEIENEMGRVRIPGQYSSRTMDVDILFYNEEVIHEADLIIPHEKLHQRRFTLEPLVEIAPDFIHPLIKKSLLSLLDECDDHSMVKRLSSES